MAAAPALPAQAELDVLMQAFRQGDHARLEHLALGITQRYPHFAPGWKALGVALKQGAKTMAALPAMQRAAELAPHDHEVHCNLGIILKTLRRRDAAVASFERALALNPQHVLSWVGLARLHADEGAREDAVRCIDKALALDAENADALALQAALRKFTAADTDWLALANKVAGRPATPPHERALLLYALGKFHDDTLNHPAAFACYRAANALRKAQGHPYNAAQTTDLTDRIIAAYPAAVTHAAMAGANDSMRPLFIVGMPRSGTSLLEQILASHPAIHGAGELPFWGNVVHAYPQVLTSTAHPPEWLDYIARECLADLDRHDRQALRVINKMPGNFQRLGLIHAVFPQARILHMRRNPADTCLSIYFQDFHGGHPYASDLGTLAHYYGEYRRLTDHWRSVLPAEVFLDVAYEDLVDDLAGWSRRVFAFIGLDWDPRCLEFHATERRIGTASNWQARQPLYRSSKERWRNYADFVGQLLPLLEK